MARYKGNASSWRADRVHIFLEAAGFGAAMLLVGSLGTVPLAAHNVTLQLAALTYMVPLGVSAAAAVLVGRAIGARQHDVVRREAAASLVIGVGFIGVTALAFLLGAPWLARAFTSDPAVVALATTLIRIAGVFQLFDGAQVVATGILRGAADTRVPMLMNLVGYFVLGVPIGALLCFALGWGVPGIWWGLVVGLAGCGVAAHISRCTPLGWHASATARVNRLDALSPSAAP